MRGTRRQRGENLRCGMDPESQMRETKIALYILWLTLAVRLRGEDKKCDDDRKDQETGWREEETNI